MTERYLKLKLSGRCVSCQAGLQEDDGVHCVECVERRRRWASSEAGRASTRATARRYTQTAAGSAARRVAMARRRASRRAAGLCIACCVPVASGLRCEKCAERHSATVMRSRAKQREVIA